MKYIASIYQKVTNYGYNRSPKRPSDPTLIKVSATEYKFLFDVRIQSKNIESAKPALMRILNKDHFWITKYLSDRSKWDRDSDVEHIRDFTRIEGLTNYHHRVILTEDSECPKNTRT